MFFSRLASRSFHQLVLPEAPFPEAPLLRLPVLSRAPPSSSSARRPAEWFVISQFLARPGDLLLKQGLVIRVRQMV